MGAAWENHDFQGEHVKNHWKMKVSAVLPCIPGSSPREPASAWREKIRFPWICQKPLENKAKSPLGQELIGHDLLCTLLAWCAVPQNLLTESSRAMCGAQPIPCGWGRCSCSATTPRSMRFRDRGKGESRTHVRAATTMGVGHPPRRGRKYRIYIVPP